MTARRDLAVLREDMDDYLDNVHLLIAEQKKELARLRDEVRATRKGYADSASQLVDLLTEIRDLLVKERDLLRETLDKRDVEAEGVAEPLTHDRVLLHEVAERVDRLGQDVVHGLRLGLFRGLYPNLAKTTEALSSGLKLEASVVEKAVVELHQVLHSSVAGNPEGKARRDSATAPGAPTSRCCAEGCCGGAR